MRRPLGMPIVIVIMMVIVIKFETWMNRMDRMLW